MTLDKDDIATAKEMVKTLQQSKNDELIVVGNLLAFLLKEREALAQPKEPEQEPVAFPDAPQTIYLQVGDECPEDAKWKELVDVCWCDEQVFDNDIVYVRADITPPHRKPLTDEQMNQIWFEQNKTHGSVIWRFARAIEAAHGITSKETDT